MTAGTDRLKWVSAGGCSSGCDVVVICPVLLQAQLATCADAARRARESGGARQRCVRALARLVVRWLADGLAALSGVSEMQGDDVSTLRRRTRAWLAQEPAAA